MTEEELTAIEARATAATREPWIVGDMYVPSACLSAVSVYGMGMEVAECQSDADGAFIAAARADVPALVAEVRRLRALVERAFQEGQDGRILDGHDQFVYDVTWEHSDAFKALEAA